MTKMWMVIFITIIYWSSSIITYKNNILKKYEKVFLIPPQYLLHVTRVLAIQKVNTLIYNFQNVKLNNFLGGEKA